MTKPHLTIGVVLCLVLLLASCSPGDGKYQCDLKAPAGPVIEGLRGFRNVVGRDAGTIGDDQLLRQLLPKVTVLSDNGRLSFQTADGTIWSYWRLPNGFELSRRLSWGERLNVRVRNGVEQWSVDPGEGRPEPWLVCEPHA